MNALSRYWLDLITGKNTLSWLLRPALFVASLPYMHFMQLRNKFYDWGWLPKHHVSVPVVVVGNLTVGGTGKTPAVEYLCFYRRHGRQVAILSRGYGVQDGRNDEAHVLEANLNDVPHMQASDRVALARTAIEELESDLLILDDGFQHRRLHRDLDIVLIDATQPGRWCLPAGLLREPRFGVRRAHAIIITRSDQVSPAELEQVHRSIGSYYRNKPIAHARHAPMAIHNLQKEQSPEALRGQSVAAVSGIGNPLGFLRTLEALGAKVIEHKVYADHHAYTREDVAEIEAWAKQLPPNTWLVTTQKDWVKLRIDQLGGKPLWSLRIALEITHGQEALDAILTSVLEPPQA